jgi:hypothetical protein
VATIYHASAVRGELGENMWDGKVVGVKVETDILQTTGQIRVVTAI